MKLSEIYRKAAELVERGVVRDSPQGACSAIADAMYPRLARHDAYEKARHSAAISTFITTFHPSDDGAGHGLYWGAGWGDTREEQTAGRVVALCFMAAIAESEGK
jgi:hypothetical protein